MANTAEQDHLNQTIVTTLENDNHNTVEENKVGNEIDEGDDKCVEVEVETDDESEHDAEEDGDNAQYVKDSDDGKSIDDRNDHQARESFLRSAAPSSEGSQDGHDESSEEDTFFVSENAVKATMR
jgi:hypothetical protein